ncbi:MAG: ankyrin repeat domain-containing protein [Nitrosomonas sp.]|nr:ankyrin repeat domain-containing protein [Nitrosomonas sp.]
MERLRMGFHAIGLHGILLCMIAFSIQVHAGVDEDLIRAVENNNAYRAGNLLARGANPDARDSRSYTALMLAARHKKTKLVELLLAADADVNLRNRYGETAIMLASYHGQVEMVKQLYKKNAHFEHAGWSPLIYAATNGHHEIVAFLLDSGAHINATTDNGTTALMMAVRGNHYDTVKLLLTRGANLQASNEAGETALNWADKKERNNIVKLLRENGHID